MLVLLAVTAGVLFLNQGEATNRSFTGQAPHIGNSPDPSNASVGPKCNEVEIYSNKLAQLELKGTNGNILNSNTNSYADWLASEPLAHGQEYWEYRSGTKTSAVGVRKYQGSAVGCIPVCFWSDTDTDNILDAGETYFNYNTHPRTGIGPIAHHRGILLRTATKIFGKFRGERNIKRMPAYSDSNFDPGLIDFDSGLAGVRVGTDNQSCVTYDADGNTVAASTSHSNTI